MSTNVASLAARRFERQRRDSPDSGHGLLLGVCCVAQFMVILDVSIVNVALPSIHRSLGFSASNLVWVVNAYTITFAGFLMLMGRAADLFGGRRTFVTGLLLFATASLLGGTAATRGMLVGARALQGLGGAGMAAASLAIITYTFAPGPARHRAIGLWGAMNGAGGAAGTLLGGIITQELTWRWVLLINLPIGVVAAVVAYSAIAEHRGDNVRSFDLAGALTITLGLLAFVYGVVSAGPHGWGSSQALVPIGIGVLLLALFLFIEGRVATDPLVPLRIFQSPMLRASNIVVVLLSAALFPMWYFSSLYLQEILGLGPLDAGLAFLPMALTIMACAGQAGVLVGRFGAGRVLAAGLILMAAGLALFLRLSVDGSYVKEFLPASVLIAVGVGLSIVPSTIAATSTAAPREAGLVSGLVNTSRQMGGAVGLALLSTLSVLFAQHLVNVDYRAPVLAVMDGFHLAFALGAVFCALAALVTFFFLIRVKPAAAAPAAGHVAPPAGGGAPHDGPRPAEHGAAPAAPAPAPEVAPAPAPEVPPVPAPEVAGAPAGSTAGEISVRLTCPGGASWALPTQSSSTLAFRQAAAP
ncbi:MAG TPA: MFS transporter [Solirubrobacteraceae bacterium]|nr:MFS transporter [Solirubrobacteraceae bacterium]